MYGSHQWFCTTATSRRGRSTSRWRCWRQRPGCRGNPASPRPAELCRIARRIRHLRFGGRCRWCPKPTRRRRRSRESRADRRWYSSSPGSTARAQAGPSQASRRMRAVIRMQISLWHICPFGQPRSGKAWLHNQMGMARMVAGATLSMEQSHDIARADGRTGWKAGAGRSGVDGRRRERLEKASAFDLAFADSDASVPAALASNAGVVVLKPGAVTAVSARQMHR